MSPSDENERGEKTLSVPGREKRTHKILEEGPSLASLDFRHKATVLDEEEDYRTQI